jgi:hypothetical protein
MIAYRSASGSECWSPENVRTSLRLMEKGLFNGRDGALCVARDVVQPDVDAIVVIDSGGEELYLRSPRKPPPSTKYVLIGERLEGAFTLKTTVAHVDTSKVLPPPGARCLHDVRHAAVCIATGVRVPFDKGLIPPANPAEILPIASRYLDHEIEEVRLIAQRLTKKASQELGVLK